MEELNKNITTGAFYKILASILLAIVAFFCASIYNNIITIQRDLVSIKMHLTKIETSNYITKLEVIEILEKYIAKYHKDYLLWCLMKISDSLMNKSGNKNQKGLI